MSLLEVRDLQTHFFTRAGVVKAVDGVSFDVAAGEVVGLVGESGSGKSVTGLSILGLIDPPGRIVGGSVKLAGQELVGLAPKKLRALRGQRIAMVFQDPMSVLNPVLTIATQMRLALEAHGRVSKRGARARSIEALTAVRIPDAAQRLDAYPHQFSGGMRQRVAIAIALLHRPALIVCDEPTTALDVSIQAQILTEMRGLVRDLGMALIWISHDLATVSSLASRILVMYAGRIIEEGPTAAVLRCPRHPYSRGLLESLPSRAEPGRDLRRFRARRRPCCGCRRAARFARAAAKEPTCACGCPRSSATARAPSAATIRSRRKSHERACRGRGRLEAVRAAAVVRREDRRIARQRDRDADGARARPRFARDRSRRGRSASSANPAAASRRSGASSPASCRRPPEPRTSRASRSWPAARKRTTRVQMVFQDPFASLDPRMRVGQAIAEGRWRTGWSAAARRAPMWRKWLEAVGLDPDFANRFPHQFSGGQRQRIAIARALAMQPDVLVCDEPVASLDVSIQAQIINLLLKLRRELGLTMLFISHDLGVVRHISDRVAIMYLGRIVEIGEARPTYANPLHPYTRALLDSVPKLVLAGDEIVSFKAIRGELPSALSPPPGCHFHLRCPHAVDRCRAEIPTLREIEAGRRAACHLAPIG